MSRAPPRRRARCEASRRTPGTGGSEEHALDARSDLGHLWYLSVELHVFVCAAVAIALWVGDGGRWSSPPCSSSPPSHGGAGTSMTSKAGTAPRCARRPAPTPRSTAFSPGSCGTVSSGGRGAAAASLAASSVLIVAVVFSGSWLGIDAYFKAQGIVIAAATSSSCSRPPWTRRGRALPPGSSHRPPFRVLGEVSLPLYVWHLPLFWFVSRHTTGRGERPANGARGADPLGAGLRAPPAIRGHAPLGMDRPHQAASGSADGRRRHR